MGKTFSASPVLAQKPVFGTEPVIGPVATEVHVKQPIYKTRTYHQTHQVVNTVAQPAVAVGTVAHVAHAAPAVAAVAAPAIAAPAVGAIAAPAVGLAGLGYAGHGLIGAHAALPVAH